MRQQEWVMSSVVVAALCLAFLILRRSPAAIVVTPEVLDFGDVEHDRELTADFLVTNEGSRTLTLSNFAVSCGCIELRVRTAGSYGPVPERLSLPPGVSISIRAGMTSGSMKGPQTKQIQFQTDSPDRPLVTIDMKANLFGRLHAIPPALHFDGSSSTGSLGLLVLTDGGRQLPFELDRVEVADKHFQTIASPIITPRGVDVGGIPRYTIEVLCPDITPGQYRTQILIYEVGVKEPVLSIPLAAHIRSAWTADPPSIVFPRRGLDNPYAVSVLFKNTATPGTMPGHVEVSAAPPWLEVEGIAAEEGLRFRVNQVIQRDGGQALVKISLECNSEKFMLDVPVFVMPAGHLSLHDQ